MTTASLIHWATLAISGSFMNKDKRLAYWRANLRLVGLCLIIWFVCSYGFGILFVEQLNTIRIGGFQLGFWFAQQGSIYIFVLLIFFYAWRMNRIDVEHDVHED
jgi:putative solute:sodium symporter small subunit